MSHAAEPAPRKSLLRGPMLVIFITIFLNIMGLGLILPILPFYATAYGASGEQVGLLFTAFSALQFLAAPIFGAISDRIGRRPIILFGLAGQVVAYSLMGSANTLAMLFVSRILAGATAGNISATNAYVADVTTWQERTRAYGLTGAAYGAGLVFGPAIGGALTLIDVRAPAYGAACLVALNLLFGALRLPESLPPDRRSRQLHAGQLNPFGLLVPLVRRPVLRGPLLATFLLNVAITGFQANFAIFAGARFGFGPALVAEIFTATGLANIFVQAVVVPRLSTRWSDDALVLTGAALNAAGNLAIGYTPVANGFWGAAPVLTGGYSMSRGPLISLVTKLVKPTEQGTANGGVQAAISFAGIVGPIWAGAVYERVGQAAPYWTNAGAIALAMVAVILRSRPAPAPRAAPEAAAATVAPPPSTPAGATALAASGNGTLAPALPGNATRRASALAGSLEHLGLGPVVAFLLSLGESGCLRLWRDGWHGELYLEGGALVGAQFHSEHGAPALDAILLLLAESEFTFDEGVAAAERDLQLDGAAFEEHLARLPARRPDLLAAFRPAAVPVLANLAAQARGGEDVSLEFGALRTLLAIDGKRAVLELSEGRGLAQLLGDLHTLLDLGVIQMGPAPTAGELTAPAAPATARPAAVLRG